MQGRNQLVAKYDTAASPVTVAAQLAQCPNSRHLMKSRKMGQRSCGLYFPDYVEAARPVMPRAIAGLDFFPNSRNLRL
jgi:hypothetical protein